MAGAAGGSGFRRNGDGSPDIAFYRRRAGRLRRAARAALWRSVRRRTAGVLARALSAALQTSRRRPGADVPGACAVHLKEV